jgi:excisionase family DNA binding protein
MPRSKRNETPPADDLSDKYLTTKQVASLLHVKERKIYDLAAAGDIPGTRALGKWLFEREAIDSWLEGHNNSVDQQRRAAPPNVVLGSHDPLLEWSVRESNSGLASFLDGSLDGLNRFQNAEGIIAGIHIFDPQTDDWNVPAVSNLLETEPAVLVEWAWRERGLIVAAGNPHAIKGIQDLAGKRIATRQQGAGSQVLFEHYLEKHAIGKTDANFVRVARTESDAALAVLEGEADAVFGLKCLARQFRLDFVPVVRERFDLLVWRREWFEPPYQRLMAFTKTREFKRRAETLTGYDVAGLGTVHFNGKNPG